jgi:hypothetical protein
MSNGDIIGDVMVGTFMALCLHGLWKGLWSFIGKVMFPAMYRERSGGRSM